MNLSINSNKFIANTNTKYIIQQMNILTMTESNKTDLSKRDIPRPLEVFSAARWSSTLTKLTSWTKSVLGSLTGFSNGLEFRLSDLRYDSGLSPSKDRKQDLKSLLLPLFFFLLWSAISVKKERERKRERWINGGCGCGCGC